MSDDRFKQARRSLIDRQDEDGEDGADATGQDDGGDGEDYADEKTMMVNLDDLAGGQQDGGDAQGGAGRGRGGNQRRQGNDSGQRQRQGNRSNRQGQQQGGGRRGGRPKANRRGGSPGRNDRPSKPGDDFSDTQDSDPTGAVDFGNADSSPGGSGLDSGSSPSAETNERIQSSPSGGVRSGGGRQSNNPSGQRGPKQRGPDQRGGQRRQRSGPQAGPNRGAGGQHSGGGSSGRPNRPAGRQQRDSGPTNAGQGSGRGPSKRPQRDSGQQGSPSVSVNTGGQSSSSGPGSGGQQVFVPGDGGGGKSHDEKTAFVDLNKFAEKEPESTTFTPDEQEAGYEGSTQFVQIDALQQGGGSSGADIAQDEVLRQGYAYSEEDIRRGEITMIFARNGVGEQVILRQVWPGEAAEMPTGLRERINELNQLDAPNIAGINGMLIADSGAWVEVDRPRGRRMSDVLQDEGPQNTDRVVGWIRQIGIGLSELHNHGIVYAHLTPKSVWIDQNDNAMLEPFDVVRLEDRGDLGQFGPPELAIHDDTRNLSPSTDVYSLAAVTLAGLTGIPLHPERVAAIESDKITKAVREAVIDAPRERTQQVDHFVDQLDIEEFSLLGDFDPAEVDIKVVGGVVAVLMLATVGLLMLMPQNGGKKNGAKAKKGVDNQAAAGAKQDPSDSDKKAGKAKGATASGSTASAVEAKAQPPGAFHDDPRLTLATSYRTNPPADTGKSLEGADLQGRLDELRGKARSKLDEAEELGGEDRQNSLKAALKSVTAAIRLQEGRGSSADQKLLDELYEKESVQDYYDKLIERVEENIKKGAISDAQFAYRQLSSIDPKATAEDFFTKISTAQVRKVSPNGGKEKSDEE